jgi:hypothetical protein
LGARLWRAWAEARAAAAEEEEEEEGEDEVEIEEEEAAAEEDAMTGWAPRTPEEARGALEGVLWRGAQLVRRGRWLARLGESSLAWRPRTYAGAERVLVFEKGRVVRALDVEEGRDVPVPPGWPRAASRRLASFDAATYDRLRVLTLEIRRLVSSGCVPRLRLDPRVTLEGDGLVRRLFWV